MHNKKMENAKDFKGSLKRLILESRKSKMALSMVQEKNSWKMTEIN